MIDFSQRVRGDELKNVYQRLIDLIHNDNYNHNNKLLLTECMTHFLQHSTCFWLFRFLSTITQNPRNSQAIIIKASFLKGTIKIVENPGHMHTVS